MLPIGSATVRALLDRELDVVVLDDRSTGSRDRLRPLSSSIRFVQGSVTDSEAVYDAATGYDLCLHLAAQTSVTESFRNPAASASTNIFGLFNVLDAARKRGMRRIVSASSAAVYGDTPGCVSESSPLAPISPYGAGKAAAELHAMSLCKYWGMEFVALRYFNVYGDGWAGPTSPGGVIDRHVRSMLTGAPLTVFGDGTQCRDFVFIEDVAKINAALLESDLVGAANVDTGVATSINQVVELLCELSGQAVEVRSEPARASDIRFSCSDSSRLLSMTGAALTTLREGLARILSVVSDSRLGGEGSVCLGADRGALHKPPRSAY